MERRPRHRLSLNPESSSSDDSCMSGNSSAPSRKPLLTDDDNDHKKSMASPSSPVVPVESRLDDIAPLRDATELAEEKILNVVDRFEDEWDGHTYEEIVPLDIKLALEETVFGWSHLCSEFIGYFVFTFGAYAITYVCLYHFTQTPRLTWVRWMLSLFAGWSSFRMVRRRRKVWFRAAYGTKEYRDDEDRRRLEVAEADKASWLGRIRSNRRRKKLAKQLSRAETSFSRHHEQRLLKALAEPETYDSDANSPDRRRLSFRTDPVPVMVSIKHDQITFSEPICRVPYAHGSYFGAAPFLLANPHWISVLRRLMPDVYVEISRRVGAESQKLIHWAENNPVVAAYGTAQDLEYNGSIPTLEWDIFLDPALVRRVEIAMRARQEFLEDVLPQYASAKPYEKVAESAKPVLSRSQYNILRYYEKELVTRVQLLVDEMLIAHGSLTQLIIEQTGFGKHYNYSRVKRTRRTLGGGIYARHWMAVYAESLRIGLLGDSMEQSGELHSDLTSLDTHRVSACPNTTVSASVTIANSIAKDDNGIGLLLDLKSRHVPKPVLGCVVDCIRDAGIRMDGVGTFYSQDIRGVSDYCCEPVKEILYFHSAGDFQVACHQGRIRMGDAVFFNAGSLLWQPNRLLDTSALIGRLYNNCCQSFDPDAVKRNYHLLPNAVTSGSSGSGAVILTSSTIEAYKKRFNLSIGMYVQEFAIDEAAVEVLVRLVNGSPHVYDLGLSWGGVNGVTVRGIKPGRFTSTDGFWNQRYIGAAWDSSRTPPP